MNQRTADDSGFPFNAVNPPVVYTPDMCPNASRWMARNVNLMIGSILTEQDVEDVVCAVKKVAAQVL